ncbi:MAG: hypothetical protein ABIW31_06145 [Novosphingobium sp.]
MKKTALFLAVTASLLIPATTLQAKPKLTPQQQLDKLLEGRVAGKPTSCISLSDSHDTRVLDGTAIVYGFGNTIYVNRTTHPQSLDSDDVQVVRITGSELCRLDIIQLHDRSMGMWRGFVGLEDFVPYRRVPKPS